MYPLVGSWRLSKRNGVLFPLPPSGPPTPHYSHANGLYCSQQEVKERGQDSSGSRGSSKDLLRHCPSKRKNRVLGNGRVGIKRNKGAVKKVALRGMAGWQNFIVLQEIGRHPGPHNVESALGNIFWKKSKENTWSLPQSRISTSLLISLPYLDFAICIHCHHHKVI